MLIITFILLNLFAFSYSAKNTLYPSCLCDVSNQCDTYCCCDPQCSTYSKLVSQWTTYGQCNDDSLSIPMCSSAQSQPSLQDLHSGLKTIYTVIKRLFCISSINIINVDTQYTSSSTTEQQSNVIQQPPIISSINPALNNITNLYNNITLPIKNSFGICKTTSNVFIKTKQQIPFQSCKILVSQANKTSSLLSISTYTSKFSNIKIMKTQNTGLYNTLSQSSSLTTTCPSATSCNDVVKFVKLIFQGNTSILSSQSYIIVGNISWNSNNPFYTTISYSYQFVSTISNPTSTNQVAYKFGSPLQLLNKVTVAGVGDQYYRIFNPIHLSYKEQNGNCKVSTSQNYNSQQIMIQFGRDIAISCNTAGQSASTISPFNDTSSIFSYIGKISSPKNIGDYIQVKWPTGVTLYNSVVMNIFYSKVGSANSFQNGSGQYSIVSVSSSTVSSVDNRAAWLYIKFNEVSNNPNLYIPSPPVVQAYLPNDFLSPFIVG